MLITKDLHELMEKVIDRCRDAGNVIIQIVGPQRMPDGAELVQCAHRRLPAVRTADAAPRLVVEVDAAHAPILAIWSDRLTLKQAQSRATGR